MNEPKPGSKAGSDWNQALSDALGRVAQEKAAATAAIARAKPKSRRGSVIVGGLALTLVLAWDVWRFAGPGSLPTPDEQAFALRRSVAAVAKEALAIRAAEGVLPGRERVAHMLDDALTYRGVGDHLLITNTDGEYVVIYDGSRPVDEWVQNGGYRRQDHAP